jgi:hypothetical protein
MPKDMNQLAKAVVDLATGSDEPEAVPASDDGKDPAAVALGRKGGLKGGKARWVGVSAEQRSRAARKAVRARWAKKKTPPA